jgi:hypothetical protein
LSLLKDGSFSFGFSSKGQPITEYGSAVFSSGEFKEHSDIITSGKVAVSEVKDPHYTFHPPRLNQRFGLVQMRGANGIADRWELDWFPGNWIGFR